MADSLDYIARSLLNAAETVAQRVAPVVTRGAVNIHDDARSQLAGADTESEQFAERNIGFERDRVNDLSIAIGYPDEIAPLGRAVEYGSVHRGPGGQLNTALGAEAPQFVENVLRVGSKVWR